MSITLQCGISFIAGVLLGISLLYLIQYLNHRRNKAHIKREFIEYYNSLIEDKTNSMMIDEAINIERKEPISFAKKLLEDESEE